MSRGKSTNKTPETTKPNACSACFEPVQVRRPSKSGKHWCQKRSCQNAKQKFYREQRLEQAKSTGVDKSAAEIADLKAMAADIERFFLAVMHSERLTCSQCNRADAIRGFPHPDAESPRKPCFGTGGAGTRLSPAVVYAVWPITNKES